MAVSLFALSFRETKDTKGWAQVSTPDPLRKPVQLAGPESRDVTYDTPTCEDFCSPQFTALQKREERSASPLEGVIEKTAFSPARAHIFTNVECLSLYFNRTHNTQNILFFKTMNTRYMCTANTLTTHHQCHTAIARGAQFCKACKANLSVV